MLLVFDRVFKKQYRCTLNTDAQFKGMEKLIFKVEDPFCKSGKYFSMIATSVFELIFRLHSHNIFYIFVWILKQAPSEQYRHKTLKLFFFKYRSSLQCFKKLFSWSIRLLIFFLLYHFWRRMFYISARCIKCTNQIESIFSTVLAISDTGRIFWHSTILMSC